MANKDMNSRVLTILIKMLRENRNDEKNAVHLRENAEFWLDIIGVAFIDASLEEEVHEIDHKQAWRVHD
tara:strand:+ start:1018 stop:1224 length:207 start_codon:yes stop_codon:yes gene_type:complete